MDHIVTSQLSSFAIAFVVIFSLIGLLFRSPRLVILAIRQTCSPCSCPGGDGRGRVRLDVAVTIAAIVLGLVVDDTTQFLYRYREMASDDDVSEVVIETVEALSPMLIDHHPRRRVQRTRPRGHQERRLLRRPAGDCADRRGARGPGPAALLV